MVFRHLSHHATAFKNDCRGSTAILFGLSAVPILLLVAAGIDYSRAIEQKAQLQEATDATTLAITQLLPQYPTSAVLQAKAQAFLAAAMNDSNAVITSGPTVSADNTAICMTTKTTLNATMMHVAVGMGFAPASTMTVSGASCTKMDLSYEIALVLDNSGSMNEATSGTTKIQSLQTAATQMIATMNPVASTPRAAFSIVPFSSAVKIGPQYAASSFMDTAGQSSIHWQNFQLPKNAPWLPTSKFDLYSAMGQVWSGCVEERPNPYMTTDTAATSTIPDTLFVPYLYPDEHTSTYSSRTGKWTYSDSTNTYISLDANGNAGTCTSNTNDQYGLADTGAAVVPVKNTVANTIWNTTQTEVCKYKGTAAVSVSGVSAFGSGFNDGPNLLCDSRPLTTLTNSNTVLNAQIQALYGKGDTDILGGVMWGWRTISPNGPFNIQSTATIGNQNAKTYTTAASTTNNVKVMIVMTDGMNHWSNISDPNSSAYSSLGFYPNARLGTTNSSNFRSLMDAKTLEACTNAKKAGIQIYTVGFSIPSNPIDSDGQTLLKNCASKTTMAYIAQDGSSLISTFQTISQQMSGLRLTN